MIFLDTFPHVFETTRYGLVYPGLPTSLCRPQPGSARLNEYDSTKLRLRRGGNPKLARVTHKPFEYSIKIASTTRMLYFVKDTGALQYSAKAHSFSQVQLPISEEELSFITIEFFCQLLELNTGEYRKWSLADCHAV